MLVQSPLAGDQEEVMTSMHTINVPLPDRPALDPDDEDDLRRMLEAIAGMRYERESDWRIVLGRLRAAGWSVEYGLQWHVVARRGRDLEEACGSTRSEAFEKLDRVTRVEALEGMP
jgi:hypothetical protein